MLLLKGVKATPVVMHSLNIVKMLKANVNIHSVGDFHWALEQSFCISKVMQIFNTSFLNKNQTYVVVKRQLQLYYVMSKMFGKALNLLS
jgi:hypothetical protein